MLIEFVLFYSARIDTQIQPKNKCLQSADINNSFLTIPVLIYNAFKL